jgi:hypothetical protein
MLPSPTNFCLDHCVAGCPSSLMLTSGLSYVSPPLSSPTSHSSKKKILTVRKWITNADEQRVWSQLLQLSTISPCCHLLSSVSHSGDLVQPHSIKFRRGKVSCDQDMIQLIHDPAMRMNPVPIKWINFLNWC